MDTGLSISIHALREEGDLSIAQIYCAYTISIHALREEGDSPVPQPPLGQNVFLSTPSARRATGTAWLYLRKDAHISIHALREEGDLRICGPRP